MTQSATGGRDVVFIRCEGKRQTVVEYRRLWNRVEKGTEEWNTQRVSFAGSLSSRLFLYWVWDLVSFWEGTGNSPLQHQREMDRAPEILRAVSHPNGSDRSCSKSPRN